MEGTGGIASSRSVMTEVAYAITMTGREYVSGSGHAFTAREDERPPRIAPRSGLEMLVRARLIKTRNPVLKPWAQS